MFRWRWNARTGTKIEVCAIIWVAGILTFWVVVLPLLCIKHPQLIPFRDNIKDVVHTLTGGGGAVVLIVEARKMVENSVGKMRSNRKEGAGRNDQEG